MIVCAGGCGCRVAKVLSLADEIVCVGSPMDVAYAPSDVVKVVVDAGSDTGAHRDHVTAFRQLSHGKKENAAKLRQLVNAIRKSDTAPVVVFGLGGAVGLAVARYLVDNLSAAVLTTVLPHPDEPEAARATAKWSWLKGAKKFGNCIVAAVKSRAPMDEDTLIKAAGLVEDLNGMPLDVVVNRARTDEHVLEGKRARLEDITKVINSIEAMAKGEASVREVEALREGSELNVVGDGGSEDDDLDPWSLL